MLIRVFDVETTGIPTEDDPQAIGQAGFCDLLYSAGEATIGNGGEMLVNPGRPIPPQASAVHHIVDEDVAGLPPPDSAGAFLMGAPGARPDYFAAFNLDFDKQFFGGGGVPMICIYKAALRVWPEAPSHSNQALRYWLKLPIDRSRAMPAHSAGSDAYVSAAILAAIMNDGLVTIEEMQKWSKGAALLPRINFGKHRGARWEDVPSDYLEWVANKSDLERDAKANARHHLKLRAAQNGR